MAYCEIIHRECLLLDFHNRNDNSLLYKCSDNYELGLFIIILNADANFSLIQQIIYHGFMGWALYLGVQHLDCSQGLFFNHVISDLLCCSLNFWIYSTWKQHSYYITSRNSLEVQLIIHPLMSVVQVTVKMTSKVNSHTHVSFHSSTPEFEFKETLGWSQYG